MTQAMCNILMVLSVLTIFLSLWCVSLWRKKHRHASVLTKQKDSHLISILYASQTGTAQHYAEQTAQRLGEQGFDCELLPLDQVTLPLLQQRHNVLWLVSSYGDGDAPDHAQQFQHQLMVQPANLAHLRVAIMGLGSRQYPHFCGFGKRLNTWLTSAEARFLFEPTWVDAEHQDDIQRWFSALETSFAVNSHAMLPIRKASAEADFISCHLLQRDCLNPTFDGNLFRLRLAAPVTLQWQAGDCLEIRVPNTAPHTARFYTIANLPNHNVNSEPENAATRVSARFESKMHDSRVQHQPIELLVRLAEFSTNVGIGYGLGSHYLCQQLKLKDDAHNALQVRIHVNSGLHHVQHAQSLWLIAAGTGLSGALAQLRARARLGNGQNVLLYGERQAENLETFQAKIKEWLDTGHLSRFELALSQAANNANNPRYVTDVLQAQKTAFLAHLKAGGAVYVCGRLQGVGESVDALLLQWLGQAQLDELKASHRYCRDVY